MCYLCLWIAGSFEIWGLEFLPKYGPFGEGSVPWFLVDRAAASTGLAVGSTEAASGGFLKSALSVQSVVSKFYISPVKFLIAVSSEQFSQPTLTIGMRLATAFQAQVTVAYVEPPVTSMFSDGVSMARETMEKWGFPQPGVEVLEWAYRFMGAAGYIEGFNQMTPFQQNRLVSKAHHRELVLPSTYNEKLRLILRQGDIIRELRQAVEEDQYDVTVIGGSGERKMAHDLIEYIDSSIFVVNNFKEDMTYKLLICVDDSKRTRQAVKNAAVVAAALNLEVVVLTVSKTTRFGPGYTKAHNWALEYLAGKEIKHTGVKRTGDPVATFIDEQGTDKIIVMGSSSGSAIKKFFRGSKPQKTLQGSKSPILIVK